MEPFTFLGEESAQFTRFGKACLKAGLVEVRVAISGREPLTARPLTISAVLRDTTLDGYIRYITVSEPGLTFNVGGSNSTRSIAANQVRFDLTEADVAALRAWGERERYYVPRLNIASVEGAAGFRQCEAALMSQSHSSVAAVLQLLSSPLLLVRTEAALTLRALSSTINEYPTLQNQVEKTLIEFSRDEQDRDTRVAAIEDLGYLGGDLSCAYLSELSRTSACEQSCWAAAIALGRLGEPEDVWRPLVALVDNPSRWVRTAALLSLARRADRELREHLEPVFARFLLKTEDEQLRIYACLGLNRFREFESSTWERLAAALSDDLAQVGSKGYAALAITGAYQSCPQPIRAAIANVLATLPRGPDLGTGSIDAVWGYEFLAELASVSGIPNVASRLYQRLAGSFSDWRKSYYNAIRAYERGESEAERGDGDDSINSFEQALRALNFDTTGLPDEAIATVEFRRSIIVARRRLQATFKEWLEAQDSAQLAALSSTLNEIRRSYQTYANPDAFIGAVRQLTERERDYLKNTVDMLLVVERLVRLDESVRDSRAKGGGIDQLQDTIQLSIESLESLQTNVARSFNTRIHTLCGSLLERIKSLEETVVQARDLPAGELPRLIRAKLGEIRAIFWRSSWPMPGRACPIYGLGRAIIGIRQNGYSGKGAQHDPFVFAAEGKPVLPLYVSVIEMATGGSSRLTVCYTVANDRFERDVPVVEGDFPIPVVLDGCPTGALFTIEAKAIFVSRDCTQVAAERVYYAIKR